MNILFLLMQPFVWHPGRIAIVAGIFFLTFVFLLLVRLYFRKLNPWPLLIPTVAWSLFAVWEMHCMAKGYNIRVDLLLVSPILLLGTLGGIIGVFVRLGKSSVCGSDAPVQE